MFEFSDKQRRRKSDEERRWNVLVTEELTVGTTEPYERQMRNKDKKQEQQ